jgi:23S rRNA (uracil1939-C5)-methyltransferase
VIELTPIDIAHGGEAVARVDGKAHFVAGAMPGETVTAEVTVDKGAWARADLVDVLEPSPQRVVPPCPHFDTCGGCQWQFADYPAQLEWKRSIVAGQLAHLGRIPDPPVRPAVAPGPEYGYRNRMDFHVVGGRPALHRYRSDELVPLTECSLLQPELADVFSKLGDLGDARKITLRVGTRTGDLMAVVRGKVPDNHKDWQCNVVHAGPDGLDAVVGGMSITEEVADRTFRITGEAFFQNNTEGAETLVGLVSEALDIGEHDTVLDAYAGGGLFALTAAAPAERVIAVEMGSSAFRDLRHNVRTAGNEVRVVRGALEEVVETLDEYWTLAIVDPPRTGLRAKGVAAVIAAHPRTIVYVSCDPASLSRDARLLADEGYRLDWAVPVDLFPQTFHIETVARFVLAASAPA